MKKLFSIWILLRYMTCGIVALWGFVLIFKEGINSGGKTLLLIALIGLATTLLADFINIKRKSVKSDL
jgi:hypothetical protein